ncbi:MAG TPA: DUF1595 domain-containing protein, partial [Polyangiales bacterium]|nr:DUF1595 domain-containing protein [Polyangiales bacterium]
MWLCCASCTGYIEPETVPPFGADPLGTRGQGDLGAAGSSGISVPPGTGPSGVVDLPPASCQPGTPPPTTRLARLTHKQYDNTIAALTGLPLHPAEDFLADQRQAGFDRGTDLQVGDVLARAYRDAAESVAASVVSDQAALTRVLGCAPAQGESCARSFVDSFGKRAFRRPLTAAEQTKYLALFQQGPQLVDTGDDFQRGVRVVLEAMLQSPKFLYRSEMSETPAAGAIALSSYEVASRISYMLVSAPPDPTLMQAADADQLRDPSMVAAQATRLLSASEGARETVRDFHH